MNYFDLHCDTAYEMYIKKQPLFSNSLSVSIEEFKEFNKKSQVFAVWSENTANTDDVYGNFFDILENLKSEIDKNEEEAVFCCDAKTLATDDKRLKIIPAVEGARLIGNDLSRLEILRESGVRVLTLAWSGISSVCGAYDTEEGITEFGYKVVEMCEKLGIIIDVSHISEKGFWDIANVASKPFLASHSNASTLCNHARNLTDTQLRTIVSKGGVAGVNLVGKHLSKAFTECGFPEENAVIETVVKHIVHFIEKGCEKNVCLGCDFDGTVPLCGLEKVSNVKKIADYMAEHSAHPSLIDDIFYNNAYNFFMKNL